MAALAVFLGAFGAHGLERHLTQPEGSTPGVTKQLDQWETGVRYHMYHALGCILVGLWSIPLAEGTPLSRLRWSGVFFLGGIAFFSGGLYGYVLLGWRPLVMIVPLGGLAFLVGWLLLAFSLPRQSSAP